VGLAGRLTAAEQPLWPGPVPALGCCHLANSDLKPCIYYEKQLLLWPAT